MRRLRASALSSMAWACCCSEAAGIRNYLTISDWWGRQDSNLRSHEAADLQSAPFATRDTPPLDGIAIRFAWRRRRIGHGEVENRTTRFREALGRARLWGKHHGKVNRGEPGKLQP